jgi:hypothetical protein
MKKSLVIQQTIDAANLCLIALEQGSAKAEIESFVRWAESLVRYVFYQNDYRPIGQELEDLSRKILNDKTNVSQDLTYFIAKLREEVDKLDDLEDEIVWEPPFDSVVPPYVNG